MYLAVFLPWIFRTETLDLTRFILWFLRVQRKEVLRTGAMRASEEEELMRRAREGMEDGEDAQFSVMVCSYFILVNVCWSYES